MAYVVISNQGAAEELGMRLMGASSKSEGQIGRFGTGWKYGISGALRLGGPFTIHLGSEEVQVSTRTQVLRGTEHEEVTLNGTPIGITDQLGKDWEPWMVLREFISNAIDEGGVEVNICDAPPRPSAERTQVILPLAPFQDVVANLHDYFCLGPVDGEIVTSLGRALPREGPGVRIFKKGVLVLRKPDTHSAFDYELNQVPIGEDRVVGDVRPSLWQFLDYAPLSIKVKAIHYAFEGESYPGGAVSPEWAEAFGGKLVVWSKKDAFPDEDQLQVPYNFVRVAEACGARTLASDKAAKDAERQTMPASYAVREACKRLEKVGIHLDARTVLMTRGRDHDHDKGITYIGRDLDPGEIMEALIIHGTMVGDYQGSAGHLARLAQVVRRLGKL